MTNTQYTSGLDTITVILAYERGIHGTKRAGVPAQWRMILDNQDGTTRSAWCGCRIIDTDVLDETATVRIANGDEHIVPITDVRVLLG